MKEEKIKVLALLPMELSKEIELDNALEAMQKFIGGLIECITLSDTGSEVTLVCNDEGKLLGLPLNRPLWDGADVLAGPGFLAGCDNEGNLTSLQTTEKGVSYTFHHQYAKVNSFHFFVSKKHVDTRKSRLPFQVNGLTFGEKALWQALCPR